MCHMGYLLARVVAVGVLLSARAHNFNANKSFQDESVGHSPMMNPLNVGICFLAGVLLSSGAAVAQSRAMAQTTDIVVQALDGRNGKPLANQHLLVFTGASSDAVKSHAEHTGLTTNKNGLGLSEFIRLRLSGYRCGRTVAFSVNGPESEQL